MKHQKVLYVITLSSMSVFSEKRFQIMEFYFQRCIPRTLRMILIIFDAIYCKNIALTKTVPTLSKVGIFRLNLLLF